MKQNKPKPTKTKSEVKPKVFDVSKPGGSAPTASARPLIVTHRPMVQDPMMTAPPVNDPMAPAEGAPEVPKNILKPQKIKLQPSPEAIQALAEQAAQEKETAAAQSPKESTALVSGSAAESKSPLDALLEEAPESASKPAASLSPSSENNSETPVSVTVKSAAPESLVAPSPTPQHTVSSSPEPAPPQPKPTAPDSSSKVGLAPTPKKEADVDDDRKEEYEQIIASRKYYVHIASPAKKRSMRLAVIGAVLIILVAVGCLDAMLDAGVLDISGIPHTNFIK